MSGPMPGRTPNAREPAVVVALADRAAIQDLQLTYARGVDRRDLALVASCFAPDCAYEGALGHGTIGDALRTLEAAMTRYASTLHHVGSVLVTLDGDRAVAETSAVAYHRLRDDPRRLSVVAVRYLDELARRDGRWLITRRTVERAWTRDEEVTDG